MRTQTSKRLTLLAVTSWMSVCLLVGGFSTEMGYSLQKTWMLTGLLGLVASFGLANVVKQEMLKNSEILANYANQANTDALTGLPNRRCFDQHLRELLDRNTIDKTGKNAARSDFVSILDIDCFKTVNDTYGHPVGDKTLIFVAEILRQVMPPGGHAARIGGDEFGLVFQNTVQENVLATLTRIRAEIDCGTQQADGLVPTTASIGFTMVTENDDVRSSILRADQALYETKKAGRNHVTFG